MQIESQAKLLCRRSALFCPPHVPVDGEDPQRHSQVSTLTKDHADDRVMCYSDDRFC